MARASKRFVLMRHMGNSKTQMFRCRGIIDGVKTFIVDYLKLNDSALTGPGTLWYILIFGFFAG